MPSERLAGAEVNPLLASPFVRGRLVGVRPGLLLAKGEVGGGTPGPRATRGTPAAEDLSSAGEAESLVGKARRSARARLKALRTRFRGLPARLGALRARKKTFARGSGARARGLRPRRGGRDGIIEIEYCERVILDPHSETPLVRPKNSA